ncbi:putative serine proteinase inhibitor PI-2, partial [Toxoplasma gondii TgCatPRC2]
NALATNPSLRCAASTARHTRICVTCNALESGSCTMAHAGT